MDWTGTFSKSVAEMGESQCLAVGTQVRGDWGRWQQQHRSGTYFPMLISSEALHPVSWHSHPSFLCSGIPRATGQPCSSPLGDEPKQRQSRDLTFESCSNLRGVGVTWAGGTPAGSLGSTSAAVTPHPAQLTQAAQRVMVSSGFFLPSSCLAVTPWDSWRFPCTALQGCQSEGGCCRLPNMFAVPGEQAGAVRDLPPGMGPL